MHKSCLRPSSGQASNSCKRVLEAAKPAYANKTEGSMTFHKLRFHDVWLIANNIVNKGKSPIFSND